MQVYSRQAFEENKFHWHSKHLIGHSPNAITATRRLCVLCENFAGTIAMTSRTTTPRTDAFSRKSVGDPNDPPLWVLFARQLEREIAAKQAEIDRLMLEYCQDEMTEKQKQEWAKYQKPVAE